MNKSIKFIITMLLLFIFTACSSIKKYKPEKHTINKPKAYLKLDGSRTKGNFNFLGFGTNRISSVHIKTLNKDKNCYNYLGSITVKKNRSSDNLAIPANEDTFLKFQRIVEKSSQTQRTVKIKDSFFEFIPKTGENYVVQFDDQTKGMEAIRFNKVNSSGNSNDNVESFYDDANNSKYE